MVKGTTRHLAFVRGYRLDLFVAYVGVFRVQNIVNISFNMAQIKITGMHLPKTN